MCVLGIVVGVLDAAVLTALLVTLGSISTLKLVRRRPFLILTLVKQAFGMPAGCPFLGSFFQIVHACLTRSWLLVILFEASVLRSSSLPALLSFPQDRLFPLWDWVGGRYSVCSSVGALPLSLKYGFQQFDSFLAGGCWC